MNEIDAPTTFSSRHIGPSKTEQKKMLSVLGLTSIDQLVKETVPSDILLVDGLNLPPSISESEALSLLKVYSQKNLARRSYIGQGYYNTLTPAVIQRNIFENPGWYTQYTPYQAEIAQGRLEALLNYQTMVSELCGLELANSSLLDEGTALAEAMTLVYRIKKQNPDSIFAVHKGLHPQSLDVIRTRAEPLGIRLIEIGSQSELENIPHLDGVMVPHATTDGFLEDISLWSKLSHSKSGLLIVASDLLQLCLLQAPGKQGADIVVGNSQRFGVPLGFGGPHAAFFATRAEFQREIPGRLVGISKDSEGNPAYRLSLQTREQHIKRERATSNICTAQVLLAIMASMYAVYHGPKGLTRIARKVAGSASLIARYITERGVRLKNSNFFDTLRTEIPDSSGNRSLESVLNRASEREINLRIYDDGSLGLSTDESIEVKDIQDIIYTISGDEVLINEKDLDLASYDNIPKSFLRDSEYMRHPVFNQYHSETEMLRYIKRLESKDLSLTHSMIPLGSCTMKLNSSSEMLPLSWHEFSSIHPFVPKEQVEGYLKMTTDLEKYIGEITALPAVSLQPNSGAQGEYAGLMVIRDYLKKKGELEKRNICLIPASAHGTNPASANMAGMKVVVVKCDSEGNVDISDLKNKLIEYRQSLAALMITYPSTHGVFEEGVREICELIHEAGGYVYMDGANLNAQVGLCRAGLFGVDVCHLNLHKTFCIPHGGGGPGMGPIAAIEEFREHLPGHPVTSVKGSGAVSAAPFGSASILLISWMYIRMMGSDGLRSATECAILNANYIATRLSPYYQILYKGKMNRVAHECILDLRTLKRTCGIDVSDIAKRLMDYGFHAPTVSFPVAETLMIEPTESESLSELDRFCDAMIAIRGEISEVENGKVAAEESVLRRAPHTAGSIVEEGWDRPYSREKAVFPLEWVRERKFWPSVARVDNAYGDRNLFCVCAPVEDFQ
ncbi:MAG TPA: aminomethyl-transferring glycine dehydrogenase [Oligoflexia bacterium]|nr:aminomethyl-transferring glycine dehydrogenase [Oligoflexia bacterium]HMP48034.1 aminomethyl-transferring glycine dehydrogenase [Oligoflexia bacterium]